MAGIIQRLLGTFSNTFLIGKNKATLDASGLTAPRSLLLPDKAGTIATLADTPIYVGTSTTSLALTSSGSRTFVTQTNLGFAANMRVRATSNGTPTAFMEGVVTSYSGTGLTVQMDQASATGTFADWNLALAAPPVAFGQRIWRSLLDASASNFLLINGSAYFVYVGQTPFARVPQFVRWHVVAAGSGGQTAECGLFSTPLAPNMAAQSLTKIAATGTLSSLTTTGVKSNTTAFAVNVPAGTHLWAGIRTAMGTAQPTIRALMGDESQGNILILAVSGVLTGAGPFAGALVALNANGAAHPHLSVTLD